MKRHLIPVFSSLLVALLAPLLRPSGAMAEEVFAVETAVLNSKSGKVTSSGVQKGPMDNLFKTMNVVKTQILKELKVDIKTLPPEVQQAIYKPPTQNFKAFVAFSNGVSLADQGRYQEARVSFIMASKMDPGFTAAIVQEQSTPVNNQSIAALTTASLNKGQSQAKAHSASSALASKMVPKPPKPPTPPTVPHSGGEEGKMKHGSKSAGAAFDEALSEVTKVTGAVMDLSKNAKENPGKALELFHGSKGKLDPDLALGAILENAGGGLDNNTVGQLMVDAIKQGLSLKDGARLVKGIQAGAGCK